MLNTASEELFQRPGEAAAPCGRTVTALQSSTVQPATTSCSSTNTSWNSDGLYCPTSDITCLCAPVPQWH